jgi:hypothetical protein
MDDKPKRKPGRPKNPHGPVDVHIKIDQDLLDAISRPGCNLSNAVRRALRMYLKIEEPNNIKALAIRIRTVKSDIGGLNRELSELREQAAALGVKDLHKFEDSLESWED